MSTSPTLAFIGAGNMASAIIGGCISQGMTPSTILAIDPSAEQRQRTSDDFGVHTAAPGAPALADCDTVVWAVKPQVFKAVAQETQGQLAAGALHVSVAAGVSSHSLSTWLSSERIVRAMPNTPALVGQGATGLYARSGVDAAARQRVHDMLAPTGLVLWVDQEDDLEAVTAVSGSGPAYFFYMMEVMAEAGERMGLTRAVAEQLAIATCKGAGTLASDSADAPAVLRERVTSKGGATFEALEVMRRRDLAGLMDEAMRACAARARDMGQLFG